MKAVVDIKWTSFIVKKRSPKDDQKEGNTWRICQYAAWLDNDYQGQTIRPDSVKGFYTRFLSLSSLLFWEIVPHIIGHCLSLLVDQLEGFKHGTMQEDPRP